MKEKIKSQQIKIAAKVILDFFASYKKEVLALFFVNILVAIGNGIVPYITGKLFDSILHLDSTFRLFTITLPQTLWILISLALIQTIIAIIEYSNVVREAKISALSRLHYQVRAYSRLLELPLNFHKTHKIGEVKSKISLAGWGLENLVQNFLSRLGAEFLTVIVSLVVLVIIQPWIALFSVIGLCIFLLLSIHPIKDAGSRENKFYKAWDEAHGNADDAITNITAVKQSVAEKYEQGKIKRGFIDRLLPFWIDTERIWGILRFHQRIIIILVQISVFLASVHLVSQQLMTIGELIAFNSYLAMLFGPFVQLLNMSKNIQSGIININTVEKVMTVPTEKYLPVNMAEVDTISGAIEFQNVFFSYQNNKPILQDINFKTSAGQIIALVGESGVGKSTLIDLLSGYNFPSKGKILIDGLDIRRLNLEFLRSQIAIVPQEVILFNESIKTNIRYGNFKATETQVKEAARKAHALSFIEKFPKKWSQLVGERGVKLSVGQKQRVAIARAILRDPKVLILDEPTSALDAKSEKIIQQSLEELMRGRTTFIVAHRLSTVRKADLILVFEEGRIVESGTHQELLEKEKGVYRNLYELQVGLHN